MDSLTITLALCLGLGTSLVAQEEQDASAPPAAELEAALEEALTRTTQAAAAKLKAAVERATDDDQARIAAANAELTELTALLRGAPERDDWPRWSTDLRDYEPTAERHAVALASARLVLFETRFGVRAQTLPGWDDLRDVSLHALTQLTLRTVDEDSPSPALVWTRAFLEFLTGDGEAARTTLLGDFPRVIGGDCPYHTDQNLYWLSAARAVVLDLLGDTERALPWYHAAAAWYASDRIGQTSFGYNRLACDLVLARYAEHLVDIDAAEGAEHVLQELTETWEGSLGQRIAERALRERVPTALPERPQLFFLFVPGHSGWQDATGMLALLGDPRRANEARVLGGSVAYQAPPDATLARPLADVDAVGPEDPRLREALERLSEISGGFGCCWGITQDSGW